MNILEDRGYFWWADETLAEGVLAPASSVAGQLQITEGGSITLELDGNLPSKHGPLSMMEAELPKTKGIKGILKGSNKHVLLLGLIRNGGQFRSAGISYERFFVGQALVSASGAIDEKRVRFRRMEVPLEGLEQWLRLRGIKVSETKGLIAAKYKRPKDAEYRLAGGKLTIRFKLRGQMPGAFDTEVSMKETAYVQLWFSKPLELDAIMMQYNLLEEFFILLTDADFPLAWPSVLPTSNKSYQLHFTKLNGQLAGTPPKYYECVTNFPQLREQFGNLWSNWKRKREAIGPGLYLYLGTRRGVKLYVEHRFVNLVWGLEAFHRKQHATTSTSRLTAKVERILAQVGAARDRKWLSKKLENASEPSLGERIFEVLSAVPLGLDPKRLRTFSDSCAKSRNDISHFGGEREAGGNYTAFITDLNNKSEALSTLYHMLLLHEIGVSPAILKWWVFEGFRSFPIKSHLVRAGLLEKAAIEPKPPGGS